MHRPIFLILAAAVVMVIATACTVQPLPAPASEPPPLTEWQVFDLTQPLTPDMPIWPGDPEFEIEPWATYEVDEYFINRISIGEHSGTHWGTPNTFIEGARSAEMIPAEELVIPAVVFDIREIAGDDVDYRFSVDDVKAWEAENGTIPADSIAILYTGWQDKWDWWLPKAAVVAKAMLIFPLQPIVCRVLPSLEKRGKRPVSSWS